MRHRLLLALALCGAAHAAAPPRIELTAAPAWGGWSRPGRVTELDIRVSSDAATRAMLEVAAGRQSVRAELDLQPGRVARLHVPVAAADTLAVSVTTPAGPPSRRDIGVARSESPLLGIGLATQGRVELEGFHALALGADDLPRQASAYSSIDALILDAPTLGALDAAQLRALLAHAAGCGRIVVIDPDARVRRLLEGAGGCGGLALMHAGSLADARDRLASSLATRLPSALPPAGIGELTRADHGAWHRVAVILALYFAAAALALMFAGSLPVIVLTPALAAALALAALHLMQAPSQLVVWSEGESGARLARYQAWQRHAGVVRERARVPIPALLAASAQPCDPARAMRLDFDPGRAQASAAEFDTRLFRQTSLCFSGSFPMARSIAVASGVDGSRQLRNTGAMAWPAGVLLADGRVHPLPALGPGAGATLPAQPGQPSPDAAARTAMTRMPTDGVAALWPLELGGVADLPARASGWLLVSARSR